VKEAAKVLAFTLHGLPNTKHFVAKLNLAKTTQKSGGFSFWDKNDTLIRLKIHPLSTALILVCWTSDKKGRRVYHERNKTIKFSLGGLSD